MTMPTMAPYIVNISGTTSETILTTNPMADNTTATSQTHQLFPVNRPNAITNDAIHRISTARGMNNASKSVKIGALDCAIAVSNVDIPPNQGKGSSY